MPLNPGNADVIEGSFALCDSPPTEPRALGRVYADGASNVDRTNVKDSACMRNVGTLFNERRRKDVFKLARNC